MNNIGVDILDIFTEKQRYDNEYNNLMLDFIIKANKLVELSEDLYQIEHSIKLNKISLKDYILNSDICTLLKENNINNYSTKDLEKYIKNYEIQNSDFDGFKYELALDLYKELEKLEQLEDFKIDMEILKLGNFIGDISLIKNIDEDEYQNLYNKILLQVKEKYLDNNIIDDKMNNYIILMLNDIFNYYLYGHKDIVV